MPDQEFQNLLDVLFELETQVGALNNLEAMIDVGINYTELVDPNILESGSASDIYGATVEAIGSGLAGFAGFAEGGIVRKPVLGLIGEAGPEAIIPLDRMGSMGGTTNVTINMPIGVSGEDVVRELERYTRQEGNIQIPVSSTVRR